MTLDYILEEGEKIASEWVEGIWSAKERVKELKAFSAIVSEMDTPLWMFRDGKWSEEPKGIIKKPKEYTEAQRIVGQLIASTALNENVWNDGDFIEDLQVAAKKVGLDVPDFQEHDDIWRWAEKEGFTTVNGTPIS